MDEKRLEEFKGEDEFLDKLWEIRMSPKQSEKLRLYPIDQDVLEFMDQAYAIFIAEKNKGGKKDEYRTTSPNRGIGLIRYAKPCHIRGNSIFAFNR